MIMSIKFHHLPITSYIIFYHILLLIIHTLHNHLYSFLIQTYFTIQLTNPNILNIITISFLLPFFFSPFHQLFPLSNLTFQYPYMHFHILVHLLLLFTFPSPTFNLSFHLANHLFHFLQPLFLLVHTIQQIFNQLHQLLLLALQTAYRYFFIF